MSTVRAPAAQRSAACDQLLGLHEELDFTDAATAELDVMAPHRDLAMTLDRVDLPLQRLHVGDGGEIEIAAPDIRRQPMNELPAKYSDRRRPAEP